MPNSKELESNENKFYKTEGEFAELSLESHSEPTDMNPRYTEQPKINDFTITLRSTSYSFHRTELEQFFLQIKRTEHR